MKQVSETITIEVGLEMMRWIHGDNCHRCNEKLNAKDMADSLADALHTCDAQKKPFVFNPVCAPCLQILSDEAEVYVHESEFRAYGN
tara:strand:- start:48 stop:308 length:261 start_codon:yes stop_codon:yes gene_type:complete